jgi:glycerate-2-kinase
LGEKIGGGVVICVSGSKCKKVETFIGTHPRPTGANVAASKRLIEIADSMTEKDLAIVVVSGGGSALTCWPENECDQGLELYNAFLKSNGTIHELNIVRKHLSMLKGGGFAKMLYPARVFGLVFSDVPGVHPEIIASGPTYLDTTTIADAEHVIRRYKLGTYKLLETPKEPKYFERIKNYVLVSNLNAIEAMQERAVALGYKALVLSTKVYDEMSLVDEEFARQPTRADGFGGWRASTGYQ